MKKQFLLKSMLLLCMLFVGMGAWAEDVTVTFGSGNVPSGTSGVISWTGAKETTSAAVPAWSSSQFRCYNNTSLTISTSTGKLKTIKFIASSDAYGAGLFTYNGNPIASTNATTIIWDCSSYNVGSVKLVVPSSGNAVRLKSMVVTYEDSNSGGSGDTGQGGDTDDEDYGEAIVLNSPSSIDDNTEYYMAFMDGNGKYQVLTSYASNAFTTTESETLTSSDVTFKLTKNASSQYTISKKINGTTSSVGYGSSGTNFVTNATGNKALWTVSDQFIIANVGQDDRAFALNGTTVKAYQTGQSYVYNAILYTISTGPAEISNLIKTSSANLNVGDEIADLNTYLNLPNDYAGSVTFSSTSENVEIDGNYLLATGAGEATINVTAAANGNYLETTGTITLNISKKTPVIAWTNGTKASYTIFNVNDNKFTEPTAYLTTAGPAINYSISGDAIIDETYGTVAWESAGTYVVTAQTAETDEYNASNVLTYTINVVDPTITMTPVSGTVSEENPTVTFTGNGVKIAYMDDEANENQKTGTSISTNATETSTYYVTIYDDAENEFEHDFDVFVLQNAGLAFSAATQVVSMDDEPFAALTLTNPHDLTVTYSMDITNDLATSIATIDPETGVITLSGKAATTAERKAYVVATTESDGTYAAGEARYELIINKRESNVAWSANEVTVDFDETENLPTLNNPRSLNITYDSTNKDVATISNEGEVTLHAAGTTTISASIGGSAYYDAATYEYTLNVAPKYTVTFNINGNTDNVIREESYGTGVTAPTVDPVGAHTFAGWSETEVSEETTTAPALVTLTAGKYMPNDNVTLFAVYTRIEEVAGGSSDEGEFLLYADVNGTAHYMADKPSASGTKVNQITSTTTKASAKVFTITKNPENTDQYAISYNEGGTTYYINCISEKSGSNTNYYLQSTSDAPYYFTRSTGTNGSYRFTSSYSGQIIAYRASTYNVFKMFKNTNASAGSTEYYDLELEQISGGSTTYYTSAPATQTTISITTPEGYSTFVSNVAVVVPEGMKAAVAESADNNLTWNWLYDEAAVIPAKTPVLVKGTEGQHTATITTEDGSVPTTNYLYANTTSEIKAAKEIATDASKFYVLTYNTSHEDLGFYWRVADGFSFDVPSGKVFLALPADVQAKSAFVFGDETDGIKSVNADVDDSRAYNLQGQRVKANTKGIVIVNGRKYINK